MVIVIINAIKIIVLTPIIVHLLCLGTVRNVSSHLGGLYTVNSHLASRQVLGNCGSKRNNEQV